MPKIKVFKHMNVLLSVIGVRLKKKRNISQRSLWRSSDAIGRITHGNKPYIFRTSYVSNAIASFRTARKYLIKNTFELRVLQVTVWPTYFYIILSSQLGSQSKQTFDEEWLNKVEFGLFCDSLKESYSKFRITTERIFNVDESHAGTVNCPLKMISRKEIKQVDRLWSAKRGKMVIVTHACDSSAHFISY